jgi:hypothetical protein
MSCDLPYPGRCRCKWAHHYREGINYHWPIALDLQPYPQPDVHGAISWSQIYRLEPYQLSDILPLTKYVIVLHGMTYQGLYDRALTVACGPIQTAT